MSEVLFAQERTTTDAVGTKRQVRITDMTLRDGSHPMRHQFTVEHVRDTVRALDDAGDFASDVADNAVRGGRKAAKFVVREVKEHPLRTLAIGAAVGAVVAAVIMLRNRSDD